MQPLPKVRCFQARVALEVISQNICPCLQEAFILGCHSGHIKKKIMLRMTFNMTFHYSIMCKNNLDTWILAALDSGLHKLWYPGIRDMSTWSKFGAHGEHGDVFLFSNLGAL